MSEQQPFDSSLKDLVQEQAAEIIPHLLEGAQFIDTLNVEIIRPTMRADRVYLVRYRGRPHILHIEFETGADNEMASRLLVYHVVIWRDNRLPVISIILYPFRTSIAESPLQEVSGTEELLTFHFRVLPLYKLNAQQYVQDQAICMYPLLATMDGADDILLLQAIDKLVEYYKYSESKLARRLLWLGTFMRRADTVLPQHKHKVEERLSMFNDLLEHDPYVQQQRALGEAKGRAEGKAEGEMETLQRVIVNMVIDRFPTLVELAQKRVMQIKKPEAFYLLISQLNTAPDEHIARFLLTPPVTELQNNGM
jgi:predicted transposase YdaD